MHRTHDLEEAIVAADWPDLATLELLVVVAEHGSMGAAARQLGLSQPAASRALAKFERTCGLTLLERSPHGTQLTREGALLVDWSREVLRAAERLTTSTAALRSEQSAQLRVAASMTVAEYLMPTWLAVFRRRHPGVHVELAVMNSDTVIEEVAARRQDLGFVETTALASRVRTGVVDHDELQVVVALDHPWTRRRRALTLEELAATPLILREEGSGTRQALLDALRRHQLELAPPAVVLASNAAVRTAAAAGAAPAVLSEHAVSESVQHGQLVRVPVAEGPLRRDLRAVWRGADRPTGPAGDLVDTVLTFLHAGR